MKNYSYNAKKDTFDLEISPAELDTIEAWLKEARRGIVERMKGGYRPLAVETNLLDLGNTLNQFRELQEWRKGVHVE